MSSLSGRSPDLSIAAFQYSIFAQRNLDSSNRGGWLLAIGNAQCRTTRPHRSLSRAPGRPASKLCSRREGQTKIKPQPSPAKPSQMRRHPEQRGNSGKLRVWWALYFRVQERLPLLNRAPVQSFINIHLPYSRVQKVTAPPPPAIAGSVLKYADL